jgi:riboflavin synthase
MHVALVDGLKAWAARREDKGKSEPQSAHHRSVGWGRSGRNSVRGKPCYIGAMFTGLVAATGVLAARSERGPGARLRFGARLDDGPLALGESIAVDGCCLSIAAVTSDGFEVDASAETLKRTTLGQLTRGKKVNLERALRAGDRLGGHLVTGHVDGVGRLVDRRSVGEAVAMTFAAPEELARFVAEKGSIAVSGVSLTVNAAATGGPFDVTLIPVTLAATNLAVLVPGDRVNLEVDLIARYVARLMETVARPPL